MPPPVLSIFHGIVLSLKFNLVFVADELEVRTHESLVNNLLRDAMGITQAQTQNQAMWLPHPSEKDGEVPVCDPPGVRKPSMSQSV